MFVFEKVVDSFGAEDIVVADTADVVDADTAEVVVAEVDVVEHEESSDQVVDTSQNTCVEMDLVESVELTKY